MATLLPFEDGDVLVCVFETCPFRRCVNVACPCVILAMSSFVFCLFPFSSYSLFLPCSPLPVLSDSHSLLNLHLSFPYLIFRNLHPQSPFERALNAIHTSSTVLLCHLLDQGLLAVESCDHDGNTLLHYAVAEGRTGVLRALHER